MTHERVLPNDERLQAGKRWTQMRARCTCGWVSTWASTFAPADRKFIHHKNLSRGTE